MLEASGLGKRYAGRIVLEGLNFRLRPGRITLLLGPNGAGKTTLIKLAVGLTRPSAGHIHICGRPYRELESPAHAIGVMLGSRRTSVKLRMIDDLRIVAMSNNIATTRVDAVLRIAGLSHLARTRIRDLSFGEQQRYWLARAAIGDPNILVLDEPFVGLDSAAVAQLTTFLCEQSDLGRTVLLTTHTLTHLNAIADDLLILVAGRIKYHGPIDEAIDSVSEAHEFHKLTQPGDSEHYLPPGRSGDSRLELDNDETRRLCNDVSPLQPRAKLNEAYRRNTDQTPPK